MKTFSTKEYVMTVPSVFVSVSTDLYESDRSTGKGSLKKGVDWRDFQSEKAVNLLAAN